MPCHCPESLLVVRLTDGIVAEVAGDLQLEMRVQHETEAEIVLGQRLVLGIVEVVAELAAEEVAEERQLVTWR